MTVDAAAVDTGRTAVPRLWVVGSGSALPRAGHGCSGYALEPGDGSIVLLDAGPGTVRGLGAFGGTVDRIRGVVLSHEHTDHCADLLHLLFARRNPGVGEIPELELVGPRGTAALLARCQVWAGRTDEHGNALPTDGVRVLEVDPSSEARAADGASTVRCGTLRLEPTATFHTSNAVAWRVTFESGFVLVYSGDCPAEESGGHAALAELARGADLLLVECSAPDTAPLPGHLTPSSVAAIAGEARPRHVLLTHFYPDLEPDDAVAAVERHLEERAGSEPDRGRTEIAVAAARDGLGLRLAPGRIDGWPS
ncbi:ribonuclease Z [Planctomycetes bacterium Pla163]|uniref:Ribonuclease Z n=1 Tax=Rohdeia mirabilis TaxID=2528008 RepID=A0A518D0F8_9BACT|nr:ribonuclease Z [Planctomycetes bacterium Pla163]